MDAWVINVKKLEAEFSHVFFPRFTDGKRDWTAYVPGSIQLPLFPYNRGWENQPNGRGLYTHYKDFY